MYRLLSTLGIIYTKTDAEDGSLKWYKNLRASELGEHDFGDEVRYTYTRYSYIHLILPLVRQSWLTTLTARVREVVRSSKWHGNQPHKIYIVNSPRHMTGVVGLCAAVRCYNYYDVRFKDEGETTLTELDQQYINSIKVSTTGFRVRLQDSSLKVQGLEMPRLESGMYFNFDQVSDWWQETNGQVRYLNSVILSVALSKFPNSTLHRKPLNTGPHCGDVATATLPVHNPTRTTAYYFKTHSDSYSFITCDPTHKSHLSFSGFLSPFHWDL